MSNTSIIVFQSPGAPEGREWLGLILENRAHWGILFFGATEDEAHGKAKAFLAQELAKREAIVAKRQAAADKRKTKAVAA